MNKPDPSPDPRDTRPESRAETALLVELAHKWLSARDTAAPLSASDLCRDRPELLDDLNRIIELFGISARAETRTAGTSRSATGCPPPDPVPTHVGRFEVREYVGGGSFGWVFRAFDPTLRREVAVKVPRPERVRTAAERARFLNEARAAATVRHPNVVAVHEVGDDGGTPFIVMAYISGPTLAKVLADRGGAFRPHEAAGTVRTLALAVQAAHDRGIVHRDLKPGNVLFDPDHRVFVVTDFGLAQFTTPGEALDSALGVAGTPAYMPPEQARGESGSVGPRSDVYALGTVLFELLTGRTPFSGGNAVDVLTRMLTAPPPSATDTHPDVPPGLDAVCQRALAKNPADRFQSARELADALAPFEAAPPPPDDLAATVVIGAVPPPARRGWFVPVLALTVVALVAGAIALWPPRDKDRAAIPPEGGKAPPEATPPVTPPKKDAPLPKPKLDQAAERRVAEWVLRAGGKVRVVDLKDGAERAPNGAADLGDEFRVARIDFFKNEAVTDKTVENLVGVSGPIVIDLGSQQGLTDAGFPTLARIQGLRHLRVVYVRKVTDAGIKSLAGHPTLRILDLSDTGMTAEGVAALATIPNLEHLGLHGHAVTDDWLAAAAKCPTLAHLYVGYNLDRSGARVTAAGLGHLAALKRLELVDFDQARLAPGAIGGVPPLPALEELFLSGTSVTDADLAAVAKCPRLKRLGLDDTRVGDPGLRALAACESLTSVTVNRTRVTPDGVTAFRNARSLCEIVGGPAKK